MNAFARHPDCFDTEVPHISLAKLMREPHACVHALASLIEVVRKHPACEPFVRVRSDVNDLRNILEIHARENTTRTPYAIAWGLAEMAFDDLTRAARGNARSVFIAAESVGTTPQSVRSEAAPESAA